MPDRLIVGEKPGGERVFACVSPGAHHVEAAVCDRRLSALLAPFRDEAAALAAISAAGATVVEARQ